jgi:hypothetical protein
MGIEALKAQLAKGEITQEQFAAELKKLLDAGTITQEEHDAAAKTDPGQNRNGGFSDEQMLAIQKMMQSEADKVRTKAAQEKKLLEDQLETLKTEKMTAEQKAEYDRKKLEADLKSREDALTKKEVALHTIDKLTDAKLPISFKEFLVGPSKEDAERNIAAFQQAWQAAIKEEVEEKFKQAGSTPPGTGGPTNKKWSEMTLTEQGKLLKENPAAAKSLAAAAGVILDI